VDCIPAAHCGSPTDCDTALLRLTCCRTADQLNSFFCFTTIRQLLCDHRRNNHRRGGGVRDRMRVGAERGIDDIRQWQWEKNEDDHTSGERRIFPNGCVYRRHNEVNGRKTDRSSSVHRDLHTYELCVRVRMRRRDETEGRRGGGERGLQIARSASIEGSFELRLRSPIIPSVRLRRSRSMEPNRRNETHRHRVTMELEWIGGAGRKGDCAGALNRSIDARSDRAGEGQSVQR